MAEEPSTQGRAGAPRAADTPRFVLASASPRRLDLLADLGITPTVRVPDVDESRLPDEPAASMVERLSRAKANSVPVTDDEIIIAADTVAAVGDRVLGKPTDRDHAVAILELLSGTTHRVLTGVCVRTVTTELAAVDSTEIRFRALGRDEIDAYVDSGEAMGKAGAYAIQESGDSFVAEITGSRSNVVGLPLITLTGLISQLGVNVQSGALD